MTKLQSYNGLQLNQDSLFLSPHPLWTCVDSGLFCFLPFIVDKSNHTFRPRPLMLTEEFSGMLSQILRLEQERGPKRNKWGGLSDPPPFPPRRLSSGVVVVRSRSRRGSSWRWRWHTFRSAATTIQATTILNPSSYSCGRAPLLLGEGVNHGLASSALQRTGRQHDDAPVWAGRHGSTTADTLGHPQLGREGCFDDQH